MDRLQAWCDGEAGEIVGKLTRSYAAGEILSLLTGRLDVQIAAWLKSAVEQRTRELAAEVQGVQAELRRATTHLPPEWEDLRFQHYIEKT